MHHYENVIRRFGFETYEWLKSMGVSHRMMGALQNPREREFYRIRSKLGKSVGQIPPEHHETVLSWFEEHFPGDDE